MKSDNLRSHRADLGWIILGILLGALAWYLYPKIFPVAPPDVTAATLLPVGKPLADFSLLDHTGAPFTPDSLHGHWSLLFFGYTHCPDICPTTLQSLAATVKILNGELPPDRQPRIVFVSVDPERDTPDHLAAYVTYFNKDFTGVTGDPEQITGLTSSLGILFVRAPGKSPDNYLVDHSASIMMVGPDGLMHALFSPPHQPQAMAADILAIEENYRKRNL